MSKIYDILVKQCGANEDERLAFEKSFAEPNDIFEWRIQGKLGFGGKFYKTPEKMYVSCYPEDMNPKRMSIITKANKKLKDLLLIKG